MTWIASAVIAVTSTALSIRTQRQNAAAQEKAQERAQAAEQLRLRKELTAKRIKEAQEQQAAARRIQAADKATKEARATAVVASGEAGIAGSSVDALENDILREGGTFRFGIDKQLEFNEIAGVFAEDNAIMASQMNLIDINQPIKQVNYGDALMRGVSTGLSIGTSFKK